MTQISWLTCAVCLLWSAVFAWNSPLPFFRRGQRNVAKKWDMWSCTKYFVRSESACTLEKKKQSGWRIVTRSVKTKKLFRLFSNIIMMLKVIYLENWNVFVPPAVLSLSDWCKYSNTPSITPSLLITCRWKRKAYISTHMSSRNTH